jgi:hypothetical protein
MKRSLPWCFISGVIILGSLLAYPQETSTAQQRKPTAKEKIASFDYLVGAWSCGHTVGDFAGKYTTEYSKVLGGLWLKQTYDFPPGQFGGVNQSAVTAEALIGFDENRGQWVRFFASSHGEYFPIRMKETPTGWAYTYVSFFGSKPATGDADAAFTKKSDTQYSIDGPTYPENGKQVTEHHQCRKL